MKIIVNPHKLEIIKTPVNEKEINITKCEFEFSEEITNDYVKEAYFTLNGLTYKQMIFNNECDIPYEVLQEKGQVELGVVAYLVENEETIKRYNPSPAYFESWVGSLKNAENSEPITPSEMEQYEQELQDGLNELETAVTQAENLDITSERVEDGVEITTTDKTGTVNTTKVNDGETGATGNGIIDINKVGTSGLVDTYLISYTNGTSTTYDVTNGKDGIDGQDGKDYVITQQDYNAIAGVVETDLQPTIQGIENTANSANTTANTAKSIAEGANQSLSYSNYQTMITAFNNFDDDKFNVGQNIMIVTLNVPDLWISSIESTSSTYTYTTDEAFTTTLATDGYVQVGYYKLSALETQKVDLTNYVTNTDYASSEQAGVVKLTSNRGLTISNTGLVSIVKATNTEILARSQEYRPIVPSNLDYAVRSVQPAVTSASASSTQTLNDNAIYDMLITGNTTFTLPTISDNTKLHTIEIRCTITNNPTINLGTTNYIGDKPEFENGNWIIYYEYAGGMWLVGAIEVTSEA